ncbi:MAG: AMP-binding protein, partial [Ktedonobacteraceae bacterium]|nr:AMP-binding protein [Ktedonobacteraceae bacterium]
LQSDSHFQNLLPRRLLILGGEPSRWEWVQSLQVMNPQCAILNHYGPTETTVGVLTYALPSSDEALVGSMIPVGSPLANSRAYILDDAMQLAPVGTPGGLYIGGANVSRGYLNSPHMTAASFLPDPFDGQGGGRLYKTGDQARYLPNGVIEFLGRLDDQVKVHGYRVELNEITAALRSHPAVKDALVLAQAHHMRDAYLVAYTVLDTRQEPTVQDLHMYLRKRLPTYMVPTAFLFMSALPLTPAGKVDRRVLPLPDPEERPPLSSTTYVPPRTHVEHVLADIWAEVLKVARVGIHDDFFTAGGHSLLAIQIMSRIRATFQIEIPLRSLFENPSLAGLARAIEQLLPPETEEERLARLLEEIESLSDDEARKALEMRAASEE